MHTSNKDLERLHEAYSEISRYEYLDAKRILLERELNYSILEEENFLTRLVDKGINAGSDLVNKGIDAGSDIANFPTRMMEYANVSLPQYIEKLSGFLTTALISGAAGALVTQVVGRLLLLLATKMQKSDKDNEDIILRMLPDEVAPYIEKIKDLKQSNPKEYKRQVFMINQNALKELERSLAGVTKRKSSGIIQKILTFFGELLSSAAGSLFGGVVVAFLVQQLGFNPLPIFPAFPN